MRDARVLSRENASHHISPAEPLARFGSGDMCGRKKDSIGLATSLTEAQCIRQASVPAPQRLWELKGSG